MKPHALVGPNDNFRIAPVHEQSTDLNRRSNEIVDGDSRGQVGLHSDPELAQTQHSLNFGKKGSIEFGKIVYTVPYTHWYKVQLDDMDGDMPCCRLMDTTPQPFSVRDTAPYSANTDVICWIPEEGRYGFILGAVPAKVEDAGLVFPDWIVQGSNCGFKKDAYYTELMQLCVDDAGIIDFSNNRPLDALATDWGRITDLGGGIHIDPYMLWLRQSDHCGLWLFYLDMLARLEGYNLDIRTAISEMLVRNDLGEGQHISQFSPYPWEVVGALTPGATLHRETSDFAVQYTAPYGKIEPLFDDQLPFYRYQEYRGYLGQGFMRQLQAPPTSTPSGALNRASNTSAFPGLFREQIGMEGAYSLSAAHSIIIEKRSTIHIPRRVRFAEDDGSGDNENNYRASGLTGDGAAHVINDIGAPDSDAVEQEASGAVDFAAMAANWRTLHPFHYHQNDFATPDNTGSAGDSPFQSVQEPLSFSSLLSDPYLPDPAAVPVNIDHRYGSVDYFERKAGIYFLPRGGVVIRGGGGEEFRMSGGHVRISAPGGVWLQPGGNVNMYAGDDIIMRARNSVDVTTSEHDVRFKAENNMEFACGNSGIGRMLFDNKAAGAIHPQDDQVGEDIQGSGIIFKAPSSDFITACREIYLRTGGELRRAGASGGDAVTPGRIVIDAARGSQPVMMIAQSFEKHLDIRDVTSFPVEGTKRTTHELNAVGCNLDAPLILNGNLTLLKNDDLGGSDGIVMSGWISINDGHIASTVAARGNQGGIENDRVFQLKGKDLTKIIAALGKAENIVEDRRENEEESYDTRIDGVLYDDGAVGNTEFQTNRLVFSLRTDEQMNTTNFKFPENYWQQLAVATGDVPDTWEEKSITYNGVTMFPHPGQAWLSSTWQTSSPQLFNAATGQEAPRTSGLYEDFDYSTLVEIAPNGLYPVTSTP